MSRKREVLEAEDKAWHELCARIERVQDMQKPGVNGDWCVKDVLAHIAAWHALTIDRLEVLHATGTLPPGRDTDEFNAEVYDECKDLTVKDVRAMWSASRHRFREQVSELPDDIDDEMVRWLAGNAHGHYEEHIPDLDRFLESQ